MNKKTSNQFYKFLAGFKYAFEGILASFRQLNIRVHLIAAVFVIALALYLQVSLLEWAILVLTIGAVISLELMNTAVEALVDLVTAEYHDLAKTAKDVAAGAVLVSAVGSVFAGTLFFYPTSEIVCCKQEVIMNMH